MLWPELGNLQIKYICLFYNELRSLPPSGEKSLPLARWINA